MRGCASKIDPHHAETKGEIRETLPCASCGYNGLSYTMDEEDKGAIMVARDKWTRFIDMHKIAAKGAAEIAPIVADDLEHWAHDRITPGAGNGDSTVKVGK